MTKHKLTKLETRRWCNRICNLWLTLGIVSVLGGWWVKNSPQEPLVRPTLQVMAVEEVSSRDLSQYTPEQQKIVLEIYEVFGKHADNAMLLLRGSGKKSCAENRGLNPEAYNRNWTEIPGVYSSTDWGLFQINDHWQGVTNTKFLKDYKINIRMAWRIYEDNGYTFERWTCGRSLGI